MGKTRDLFKKIRDTKGTFLAKMGSIKYRNCMDLAETEDIKKRWQEYTEELYKKDLHDPDNHDGVITHLEPDILECEVKCALGSITMNKANGGDGIPVELFQILKDKAVKVLHSICQQIWKTQKWPQHWQMSVFISIPKKGNLAKHGQLFEINSIYKEHYMGATVTKKIFQNLGVKCPVLFHCMSGVRCIDQAADRPQGRLL